jgi:threonine dehydratase
MAVGVEAPPGEAGDPGAPARGASRAPGAADGPPTAADLRAVARAVRRVALRTPLLPCEPLSQATGASVWLKPENLQRTGSYKVRGAFARIRRLTRAQRRRGVIAASAGNHAQGVALAARGLGSPAVVVMPLNAPIAKIAATRELGAEVVLSGETFEQAETEARRLAGDRGLTLVHPFDDWDVIAGQASVALEVLADLPRVAGGPLQTLVVPTGGGGLLAGAVLAACTLPPDSRPRVVGVQAAGADAAVRSVRAGEAVTLDGARTIADGIRVRRPGARPLQALLGAGMAPRMVTVPDDEIARAVVYLLERAKLVAEPAGAVGVAALLSGALAPAPGERVCVVLSGGNVDVNLVARLIEHGLTRAGRYLVLRTRLDDRPGQLAALLVPLSEMRVNVIDIEHRRAGWLLPVDQSDVLLHLETRDAGQAREIIARLRGEGYDVEPLTALPD